MQIPSDPSLERRKQPIVVPDASQIRVYDEQMKAYAIHLVAGDCVVTRADNEMLVTVLGSCVSACIRDPETGIGGMNHFMLPGHTEVPQQHTDLRYGHFAMEKLINMIASQGGRRDRLEIKIFGGSSLIKNSLAVGNANIDFVRSYLASENLPVLSEDLGGVYPRRILFFPKTGKLYRLLMRRSDDAGIFDRELSFREKLRNNMLDGTTELFNSQSDEA